MASDSELAALARRLHEAYAEARALPDDPRPALTLADGYAVQQAFVSARIDGEGPVVGYKLGCTNETIQREIGVGEPIYGRLLAATVGVDRVRTGELIAPRAEPEIVVRLGEQLPVGASRDRIERAVSAVMPAIEVVDTRTGDWTFEPGLAVADNALAARLVVGPERPLSELPPLAETTVTVTAPDGERTGRGSAVLGDPLDAVTWLSRTLEEGLSPGTLISTGSLTGTVPIEAGETIGADFADLGTVEIDPE